MAIRPCGSLPRGTSGWYGLSDLQSTGGQGGRRETRREQRGNLDATASGTNSGLGRYREEFYEA